MSKLTALLLVFAQAPAPASEPVQAGAMERTQFRLFAAGTATGVVGLAGLTLGLIGLDRSLYGECDEPDDPEDLPVELQERCFATDEFNTKNRNARIMMISGLAGGGALLLSSIGTITAGLVLRKRRLSGRVAFAPHLSGHRWGLSAALRF